MDTNLRNYVIAAPLFVVGLVYFIWVSELRGGNPSMMGLLLAGAVLIAGAAALCYAVYAGGKRRWPAASPQDGPTAPSDE